MKLTTLHALFVEELKSLYSAETQVLRALPKMAKAAMSPELRQAFTDHLHQTQVHLDRLERIFLRLGTGPKGNNCRAIEAMISDGKDLMGDEAEATVMDAALIAVAQRLEHYEMASYGCVLTLVRQLGLSNAADSFQETLAENDATAKKLAELAEVVISGGVHAS